MNDLVGAEGDLTQAIKIPVANRTLFRRRSEIREKMGKYAEAISDVVIEGSSGTCWERHRYRASLYEKCKNYAAALSDYNAALSISPWGNSGLSQDYFAIGRMKAQLGNDEEAAKNFEKAIANGSVEAEQALKTIRNKQLVRKYYQQAYTKFNANNYAGALSDLDEALKMDSNYEDAYFLRGRCRLGLQDYAGSITDNNEVIRLAPRNAAAFSIRATAKRELGRLQEALIDFDKAIDLNSQDPSNFHGRGVTKQRLKNFEGAVADYARAINLKPGHIDARLSRATIYNERKEYNDAIQDCDLVLKLDSKRADAYNNRGFAKEQLKNSSGAMEDYEKAAELGNTWAKTRLSEMRITLKMQEEAARQQEEKKRQQDAINEYHQLEIERKVKLKEHEKEEQEQFTQAFLAVELDSKTGIKSPQEINAGFRQLEAQAFKLKYVNFYLGRAHFFDESAQKEQNAIRKKMLQENAIKDYRQAMEFDPFVEGAAERLEAIENEMRPKMSTTISGFFASPQTTTANVQLPTRNELTAEQCEKLDKMKQQMKMKLKKESPDPKSLSVTNGPNPFDDNNKERFSSDSKKMESILKP
jgi:tetratricopeptide (TPR) repeat protein